MQRMTTTQYREFIAEATAMAAEITAIRDPTVNEPDGSLQQTLGTYNDDARRWFGAFNNDPELNMDHAIEVQIRDISTKDAAPDTTSDWLAPQDVKAWLDSVRGPAVQQAVAE